MVADHERVFADDLEAVARVETLRAVVFAPHADPQGARPLTLEPLQPGAQQEGSAARALVPAQDVQPLDLPVAGRDVGVGQVRRARGHVSDGGALGGRGLGAFPGPRGIGTGGVVALVRVDGGGGTGGHVSEGPGLVLRGGGTGCIFEEEPGCVLRVLQFGAKDGRGVGLVEEGCQVFRRVEVTEGLGEALAGERGQDGCVVGRGAADHGVLSVGVPPS